MTPKEEDALAKHFVELLQDRNFAAVEALFADDTLTEAQRRLLPSVAEIIPAGRPIDIVTEGVNFRRDARGTVTQLIYQYEFPNKWFLITVVVMRKTNAPLQVFSADVSPLRSSLREINAFKLGGKPLGAYLLAGATLAVIAFLATSTVVCLISGRPRWWGKLLWCMALFIGVGQVMVEWTNGGITFQLLHFSWFSTWIGRLGPDGPYFFEATFPIGAVAYWIWRQTRKSPQQIAAEQAAHFD